MNKFSFLSLILGFTFVSSTALAAVDPEVTYILNTLLFLIGGFLVFPTPDFSKSLLVGVLMPKELFAPFIIQSLLFLSFVIATFLPFIVLKIKKF